MLCLSLLQFVCFNTPILTQMSYKYHERAVVFNEKNLLRIWDAAYDGYCGGKCCSILDWGSAEHVKRWTAADSHLNRPFDAASCVVIPMPSAQALPSPIPLGNISSVHFTSNSNALGE